MRSSELEPTTTMSRHQQLPKLKRRGTFTRSRAFDEDDSPSTSPSLPPSDLAPQDQSEEQSQLEQQQDEPDDIRGSKTSLLQRVQPKLRSSASTTSDERASSSLRPRKPTTPTSSASTSQELKRQEQQQQPEAQPTLSRGSRIAQSIKRRFGFFRSKKQQHQESTSVSEQDVEKAEVKTVKKDEVDTVKDDEEQREDGEEDRQRLVDVVVDVHRDSEIVERSRVTELEGNEDQDRTTREENKSAGRRRWHDRSQEEEEEQRDGSRTRSKPRRKQWNRPAQELVVAADVVDDDDEDDAETPDGNRARGAPKGRLRPISARPKAAPRSKSLEKDSLNRRLHEGFDNDGFSSDHDEVLRIETINDNSPKIKLGSDERADRTEDGISTLGEDESNEFVHTDGGVEEMKDYVPEVVVSSDNSDAIRELSPSEANESSNNTSSERKMGNLLAPSKRHQSASSKRKLSADKRSYHEEEDDDDAEDEEEQETVLNMMDKKSRKSSNSSKIEIIPSNFFERRSSDETTISTNEDMHSPQRVSSHHSRSTAKSSSKKSHRAARTPTRDSDADPILSPLITESRKHSRTATTASSSAAADEDDEYDDDELLRHRRPSSESRKRTKSRKRHATRRKRDKSDIAEAVEDRIEEIVDTEQQQQQQGRKLVGVKVHRSDLLEPDYVTRHPMVRVHVLEASSGECPNSDSDVPEPLRPQITGNFDFRSKRSMLPVWEQQLVFEMDFDRLLAEGSSAVVLLFEIVDLLGANDAAFRMAQAVKDDCWWKVAWAFLRPVGSGGILHVDKRLRLQLYRPQRSFWRNTLATATRRPKSKCEVYRWWKSGAKERYPGSLHITITGVDPGEIESAVLYEQLSLQRDSLQEPQSELVDFEPKQHRRKTSILVGGGEEGGEVENESSKWSRLAAQSCQIPNEKLFELEPGELGCFCLAFSHDGKLLACALADHYDYPIVVYEIEDGKIHVRFSGHKNFVYALHWSHDDHYILSVSSDQTARFWDVKEKIIEHVQSLPHPSYVYCGAWQPGGLDYVVTGCYDRVTRVWQRSSSKPRSRRHSRISRASTSSNLHITEIIFGYELTQELETHSSFVSAICLLQASGETHDLLVTGDGLGAINVWSEHRVHHHRATSARRSSSSNNSLRLLRMEWRVSRKIDITEAEGTPVNAILVHPRPGPNALVVVHSRNGGLWLVEALTGTVVRQFHGLENHRMQIRGCMSPCGSLLFCGGEDSSLRTWSLDSGKLLATYYPPPTDVHTISSTIQSSNPGGGKSVRNTVISCVDYHPYDHLLAHSSFGGFSPVRLLRYSRDSDDSQLGLRLHRQEVTRKTSRVGNGLLLSADALMAEAPKLNGFAKVPGYQVSTSNHRARSLNRLNGIIEKIDRILQYASGQQQNQRQVGQLQDDPEAGLRQADLQLSELRPVMAAPSAKHIRPKSARQPRRRRKTEQQPPKAHSDSAVLVRPFVSEDDEIDDDDVVGERLRLESRSPVEPAAREIVPAMVSSGDESERIELEKLDVQSLGGCSSSASVAADDTYNVDKPDDQEPQDEDANYDINRTEDNESELSNATFVIESELQEDYRIHQPVPKPRVSKPGTTGSPPTPCTTQPTPTPRRIEVV